MRDIYIYVDTCYLGICEMKVEDGKEVNDGNKHFNPIAIFQNLAP